MFNSLPCCRWAPNQNVTFGKGATGHAYESGRPGGFVFWQGRVICIEAKAARAAKRVLAFYWSGMDGPGLQPELLRKDVEKIAGNLREWVEFVIQARAHERSGQ